MASAPTRSAPNRSVWRGVPCWASVAARSSLVRKIPLALLIGAIGFAPGAVAHELPGFSMGARCFWR